MLQTGSLNCKRIRLELLVGNEAPVLKFFAVFQRRFGLAQFLLRGFDRRFRIEDFVLNRLFLLNVSSLFVFFQSCFGGRQR